MKGRDLGHRWALVLPRRLPERCLSGPLPSCHWDRSFQSVGREAHRNVDLDAVAVPPGLVHLRHPITAEGVVGDLERVGKGVVIQEHAGRELLRAQTAAG